MNEEFNEKFETIEQTLKYIADLQAKAEFLHKKHQKENQRLWEQTQKQLDHIGKHLNHITKLTGIAFEDLMFHDEKLEEAGNALKRKNPNRI